MRQKTYCASVTQMTVSSISVPKSRVFRDRAEECRTMAALFHGEKTRALLLRVAADYDCMADQAAMFELQDADREARAIPSGALAQGVTREGLQYTCIVYPI